MEDKYKYKYYRSRAASKTDTHGPGAGTYRVLRGGGWVVNAGGTRCAYRAYNLPDVTYYGDGFRCVRGL